MKDKTNPLNILMIIDSLGVGGTETHVFAIANSLKNLGHNVVVGTAGGPLTQFFNQAGLKIRMLSFQNDDPLHTNYTTLLEQTRTIIEEENIDLIHAHQIAGLKIATQISQECLIPVIFTSHGMFYPRRQLQSLIDSTAQVIAVSSPVANYLNTQIGYSRKRIRIIPNGIDTSHFKPAQNTTFRKELGVSEDEFLITLCSRIAWGKTRVIENAIHAIESLAARQNVKLAIVGSGPDSGFIHALAKMVNRRHGHDLILLTGALLDPVTAYQSSDLIIGTARVALEAMSCAKPVIAAGNAGYVGLITPENFSEAWGLYFGDHDFLLNSSARRLETDIEAIIGGLKPDTAELRRIVTKYFSVDQVVQDIENLYYQVLGIDHKQSMDNRPNLLASIPASSGQSIKTPVKQKTPTSNDKNTMESPLVSVVIPAFNREQYLKDCLDALLKQTYRPLEIVIIDDHSTDNTEQMVTHWSKQIIDKDDFTVVYHKLPRNLGFATAQTMGYFLSNGAFIANHDSDDLSNSQRIQKQVQFLQLDQDYSLVGTNYEAFSHDFNQRTKNNLLRYDNNIVKSYREGRHCVCFGSLLFRREVLEKIGGLTTFMEGAEDYEFISRAIVQGFNVQNLREVLYYYRQHDDQRSLEFYSLRAALSNETIEESI